LTKNHRNREEIRMNKLFNFFCVLAGADRDLAAGIRDHERQAIMFDGIRLLVMGLFLFGLWTLSLASLGWPLVGSLGAALLVTSLIILFDRDILANDWSLVGILADQVELSRMEHFKNGFRVCLRVGFAYVLALVTAYGMILFLFSGRIEQGLQSERTVANTQLMEAARVQIQSAERSMMGPLNAEIESLIKERETLLTAVQDAKERANDAAKTKYSADEEAQKELVGWGGRKAGEGLLYRAAKSIADAAGSELTRLETNALQASERLQRLEVLLVERRQELNVARAAFQQEERRLLQAMEQDPRWQPERGDLLSRFQMLETLKNDPKEGQTVRKVYTGTIVFLMALELFVLFSKMFKAPSTYRLKLIVSTREEAMRIRMEHDEKIARMRGGPAKAEIHIRGDGN
jgi:hypothetical protein